MNNKRISIKISVLMLIIFFTSCARITGIFEKTAPAPPPPAVDTKTPKDSQPPPEAKPPEEPTPKIEAPSFKPKADRYAIGCVLPLSGPYATEGSKALDAILLAAGIFDQSPKTPWKVIAADSRGLPEGAKEAIAYLASAENVIAIIAVAGTIEATDAAREAEKWKVPLILITAKEGVTAENYYVFQHFLTPTQQMRALARYALEGMNCAIFSILYPKDRYGTEMVKIFREEVQKIGGKVEKAISYSKTQTDFTEEISKLTGANLVSADKESSKKKAEAKAGLAVDFEALFIPDSPLRVKMIASQLAFYDVKSPKLLGTSLWNSPDLLKKGPEYLEGAVFADSFHILSYYPETNNFVDIYYSAYSREPAYIEALAYDSAGMIFQVLEKNDIQTRRDFASALIQVENYKGVTGPTSFDAERVSQKVAFILRVRNGKLEQVK
jgi:ABC-type branched-subunit amino acid transport system substrate-binding protein